MDIFRFRRFEVLNSISPMKVNTDGVLLGAAAPLPPECRKVLDAGTGGGTIALMIAQRLYDTQETDFRITGIDIDGAAVEEAGANFRRSPWSKHMEAVLIPLTEYRPEEKLDLIVSNPPYYDSSLVNPDERKKAARHASSLSYKDLVLFAAGHLSPGGILSLILPADQEKALLREAGSHGLVLRNTLRIRTVAHKPWSRIICSFSPGTKGCFNPKENGLTLMEKGKRTQEYISLTEDFYL